jgi:hypothetical protein
MTATLTITFSDEILKALRSKKSIQVSTGTAAAGRAGPAGGGDKGARARPGTFRAGSLPDRLHKWAQGRKRPFGVPDVMKKLRIKRAHASMVLTQVASRGAVRRVGRGEYLAK